MTMRTRRIVLAAVLAAGVATAAEPFTAAALMRSLAAHRTSRVGFVETKYLSTLKQPLVSEGELAYTAPSRLEKKTLRPKPETLVIDGDTLSIERDGKRRSISLASYPEVASLTDSIRATLGGDLAHLTRDYRVVVDGTREQWRLTLLPSDPKVAALVSRVTVEGGGDRIARFEVLQADGDRSVTTIVDPLPAATR